MKKKNNKSCPLDYIPEIAFRIGFAIILVVLIVTILMVSISEGAITPTRMGYSATDGTVYPKYYRPLRVDSLVMNVAGSKDTITGFGNGLTVNADIIEADTGVVATKNYVDDNAGSFDTTNFMRNVGDTVTGTYDFTAGTLDDIKKAIIDTIKAYWAKDSLWALQFMNPAADSFKISKIGAMLWDPTGDTAIGGAYLRVFYDTSNGVNRFDQAALILDAHCNTGTPGHGGAVTIYNEPMAGDSTECHFGINNNNGVTKGIFYFKVNDITRFLISHNEIDFRESAFFNDSNSIWQARYISGDSGRFDHVLVRSDADKAASIRAIRNKITDTLAPWGPSARFYIDVAGADTQCAYVDIDGYDGNFNGSGFLRIENRFIAADSSHATYNINNTQGSHIFSINATPKMILNRLLARSRVDFNFGDTNDIWELDSINVNQITATSGIYLNGGNITMAGNETVDGIDVSTIPTTYAPILPDSTEIDSANIREWVSDKVGGMVTGNTETGITVTYEDGDNTLDFAVTLGTTIESSEITDQTIDNADVDSTSNNFAFNNAYKVTTATADSALATINYARKVAGDSASAYGSSFGAEIDATEMDLSDKLSQAGYYKSDSTVADSALMSKKYIDSTAAAAPTTTARDITVIGDLKVTGAFMPYQYDFVLPKKFVCIHPDADFVGIDIGCSADTASQELVHPYLFYDPNLIGAIEGDILTDTITCYPAGGCGTTIIIDTAGADSPRTPWGLWANPYPQDSARYENPHLFQAYSPDSFFKAWYNDYYTGNPILVQTPVIDYLNIADPDYIGTDTVKHNSDVFGCVGLQGEKWLGFRVGYDYNPEADSTALMFIPSDNGVMYDLDDSIITLEGRIDLLSPSMITEDTNYVLFCVDSYSADSGDVLRTSALHPDSTWSAWTAVNIHNPFPDWKIWHMECREVGPYIFMLALMNDDDQWAGGGLHGLHLFMSYDAGWNFYYMDTVLMPHPQSEHIFGSSIYKSSFVPTLGPNGELTLHLIVNGQGDGEWHMAYTQVHFREERRWYDLSILGTPNHKDKAESDVFFPYFDGSGIVALLDSCITGSEQDTIVGIWTADKPSRVDMFIVETTPTDADCYITEYNVRGQDYSNANTRADSVWFNSTTNINTTGAFKVDTINLSPGINLRPGDQVGLEIITFMNSNNDIIKFDRIRVGAW